MFLLCGLLRVPGHLSYEINKYGPYSTDVVHALNFLVDRGLLVRFSRPGQTHPLYVAPDDAVWACGRAQPFDQQVEFVVQAISRWDRPDLEAVMTLLWFRLVDPDEAWDDASMRVREIKDHITRRFANDATQRLNDLMQQATSQGLIVDETSDGPLESPGGSDSSSRTVLLVCGDADVNATVSSTLREVGLRPFHWVDAKGTHRTGRPPSVEAVIRSMDAAQAIIAAFSKPGGVPEAHFSRSDEPSATSQLQLSNEFTSEELHDALRACGTRYGEKTIPVTADGPLAPDLAHLKPVELDGSGDQWHELLSRLAGLGCPVDWSSRWGAAG